MKREGGGEEKKRKKERLRLGQEGLEIQETLQPANSQARGKGARCKRTQHLPLLELKRTGKRALQHFYRTRSSPKWGNQTVTVEVESQ